MEILLFQIGSQRFALPISDVVETVRAVAITPLPSGPDVLTGVINYRGKLTPVVDLRKSFGLDKSELSLDHHFIVVHVKGRSVVLHADRAERVAAIGDTALEAADGAFPKSAFVKEIAKLDEGIALIPDLSRILSLAEDAIESVPLKPSDETQPLLLVA